MGLFSRLTASIRAKSRGQGAGEKSAQDYPGNNYEALRAKVEQAVEGHEPLKAELFSQTARLDQCLREQSELAVKAVREGQDEKAAGLLYHKLLISRQLDMLRSKMDSMGTELVRLDIMLSRLKIKVQAFREERKNLETRLLSDNARLRLSEAAAGLNEELAAMRYAIDRTKEKAADARKSCETARSLAVHCMEPSLEATIPDQDREPVAGALRRLKAEVKAH